MAHRVGAVVRVIEAMRKVVIERRELEKAIKITVYHAMGQACQEVLWGPGQIMNLGPLFSYSIATICWLPLLPQLGDYLPHCKMDFCKQCSECMHMLQCLWAITYWQTCDIVMLTAAALVYTAWGQNKWLSMLFLWKWIYNTPSLQAKSCLDASTTREDIWSSYIAVCRQFLDSFTTHNQVQYSKIVLIIILLIN